MKNCRALKKRNSPLNVMISTNFTLNSSPSLKFGLHHDCLVLRGLKGMIQVGQNIFDIFDSNTHPNQSIADA
jgi:hypothetical protein